MLANPHYFQDNFFWSILTNNRWAASKYWLSSDDFAQEQLLTKKYIEKQAWTGYISKDVD